MAFELYTAEIDSGRTATKRFVPPNRPNHNPSAPYRLAPIRFAPRSSVPSRFAFCRFERTRLTPRKFAIERSAPARFVRCRCAPCKFTPVRSALAKFTPQRSALTRDSPPDSTQILCWSRISARLRREIPMESPPLKTSAPAGFSVAISVFNSSISLIASISRPIRTIPPYSLCPPSGILAHFNLSSWRHRAFQGIRILRIRSTVRIPRLQPCFCWAISILSYQHCGNRLLSSTGGAEVTGGGLEASEARGFEHPRRIQLVRNIHG